MRPIRISMLLLITLATLPAQGFFLWQAEKDGHIVHLLGTVHVLTDDFYPLPGEMDSVFQEADLVIFETDLSRERMKESRKQLMARALYPDGETVESDLTPEAGQALKAYCRKQQVNYQQLIRLRPWMIAANLTQIELVRAGALLAKGMDQQYFKHAEAAGKDLGFLESAEGQAAWFTGLDLNMQSALLMKTLDDFQNLPSMLQRTYEAWRRSDLVAMKALVDDSFEGFPEIREELLMRQNREWAEEIENQILFADHPLVFVKSAHLVGDNSLLDELQARGFTIHQVVSGAEPPASGSEQ